MDANVSFSPVLSGTDANDTHYIYNGYGCTMYIEDVTLMPSVSVSAHADNHITTTISTAAGTVVTQTTDSDVAGYAAHTAGTAIELAPTDNAAYREVAAGSKITVAVVKAGTGPAYEFYAAVRWRAAR